jgi:hypothetical protein
VSAAVSELKAEAEAYSGRRRIEAARNPGAVAGKGETMSRVKIKDLDIDLEELRRKDPQILNKIRGGYYKRAVMLPRGGRGGSGGWGGEEAPEAGPDTMFCCTGYNSGCAPGPDTMFCCTGDDSGCQPFFF